ncbi:hypothetical protein, partial [Aporhodopirellula aestuarii]
RAIALGIELTRQADRDEFEESAREHRFEVCSVPESVIETTGATTYPRLLELQDDLPIDMIWSGRQSILDDGEITRSTAANQVHGSRPLIQYELSGLKHQRSARQVEVVSVLGGIRVLSSSRHLPDAIDFYHSYVDQHASVE